MTWRFREGCEEEAGWKQQSMEAWGKCRGTKEWDGVKPLTNRVPLQGICSFQKLSLSVSCQNEHVEVGLGIIG
jgi:hypothetical protein